jgi:hypothetical protein
VAINHLLDPRFGLRFGFGPAPRISGWLTKTRRRAVPPAQVKPRFLRFSDFENRILVDKDIKGGRHSMPTKHRFNRDNPLHLLLADERMQQDIGKAWDGPVISSRVLKVTILVATVTAIGIAFLSVGDPATLFAEVTASLADKSAPRPESDPLTPTIQSTADAQALPPTAKDAPPRDEIRAATDESANQNQIENNEPSSEALFRQFQAWAAEKNTQAQVGHVQPVQDASAPVAENARAPLQFRQKHRHVRPVHSARAEIRPLKNLRKKRTARIQDPPAQDVQAEDQSVQNAQVPSFLPTFGWRN